MEMGPNSGLSSVSGTINAVLLPLGAFDSLEGFVAPPPLPPPPPVSPRPLAPLLADRAAPRDPDAPRPREARPPAKNGCVACSEAETTWGADVSGWLSPKIDGSLGGALPLGGLVSSFPSLMEKVVRPPKKRNAHFGVELAELFRDARF